MTDEQIIDTLVQLLAECLDWKKVKQSVGIEKAHIAILSLKGYINRLKAENERLKQSDISKGICTIEQHAEIHKLRDELKQVRKDTAKEILYEIQKHSQLYYFIERYILTESDLQDLREKYGVEVDE